MFGSDDITWCSSECTYEGCFRNPINMKDRKGLHSYAMLRGTDLCTLAKYIDEKLNFVTEIKEKENDRCEDE